MLEEWRHNLENVEELSKMVYPCVDASVCLMAEAVRTKLKQSTVFGEAIKQESKALQKEFKIHCTMALSRNAWISKSSTVQLVCNR